MVVALVFHSLGSVNLSASEDVFLRLNAPRHTATVHALAFTHDSGRLCSAGEDKVVHVWKITPSQVRNAQGADSRPSVKLEWERTLRWDVGLGPLGHIYTVAAAPDKDVLAFGGYGARTPGGGIVWTRPASGEIESFDVQQHQQTIVALRYSPLGTHLASSDFSGKVAIWTKDGDVVQQKEADNVVANFRPLTFVDDEHLIVPIYLRRERNGTIVWTLRAYSLDDQGETQELSQHHFGSVTALAASRDGRFFASADEKGKIHVWELRGKFIRRQTVDTGRPVVSLCFGDSSDRLIAGTYVVNRIAELQVWDLKRGKRLRRKELRGHVRACAASPDGNWLAYCSGPNLHVESMSDRRIATDVGGGTQIRQVRIARDRTEGHAIVLKTNDGIYRFDPQSLDIETASNIPPKSSYFRHPNPNTEVWWWGQTIRRRDQSQLVVYKVRENKGRVVRSKSPVCTIPIDNQTQGYPTCFCWIGPDPSNDAEVLIAVGTEVLNGVYVYGIRRVGDDWTFRRLRYFRGHEGRVTDLGTAVIGKHSYLVSSSFDGTVRYWNLDGCTTDDVIRRRWGLVTQIRDGQVFVSGVDEQGPAYHHGMQEGDLIAKISWPEDGNIFSSETAEEIVKQLAQVPWHTQVVFTTALGPTARRDFQTLEAWNHLLAVYFEGREWIAWSTTGHYACSAAGEHLIGWQANGARGESPEFFPAAQYHVAYHGPEVIRRLLDAGSVEGTAHYYAHGSDPIEDNRPPEIVVEPIKDSDVEVLDSESRVISMSATATSRDSTPITSMVVLLNGSLPDQLVEVVEPPTSDLATRAKWRLKVGRGVHRILIRAETEQTYSLSAEQIFEFSPQVDLPNLYVLAIGISHYRRNDEWFDLSYAHADAAAIRDHFKDDRRISGIYSDSVVECITEQQATKSEIEEKMKWLKDQKKTHDAAVFFFSGHGIRDENNQRTYLLPFDASPKDLAGTAISEIKLAEFCMSISGGNSLFLMIDACHYGGVFTNLCLDLFSRDKTRVSSLFSAGEHTKSFEIPESGYGAFTQAILRGLDKHADWDASNTVDAHELEFYTKTEVSDITDTKQRPVGSSFWPIPLSNVRGQRD